MKQNSIRLQKVIADAGICSRRKAELLIQKGEVQVNGKLITQLGTKVDPRVDSISIQGEVVDTETTRKLYVLLNKPRGVVTTLSDPEERATVMDYCQEFSERIYPVGRLDYLSEGLLLLTNDGDLAHKIMHPSYQIEKVYEVKVFGSVNQKLLQKIRSGIRVEGDLLQARSVRVIKQLPTKTWLEFRLKEGKNREIRKICEAFGMAVDKLKRVAMGGLTIEGVAPGKYRVLTKKELLKMLGIKDDGTKMVDRYYQSHKKSIRLSKRKEIKGTIADDKIFKIFQKKSYYDSLETIKQSKINAQIKLEQKREEELQQKLQEQEARKEARKDTKKVGKKAFKSKR